MIQAIYLAKQDALLSNFHSKKINVYQYILLMKIKFTINNFY